MSNAAILHWSSRTRSGKRKPRNDDAIIAFASAPSGADTLPENGHHSLEQHDLVFAIADGMGGSNAGDVAATLLLNRMAQIIPETFKSAAAGFYPDYLSHLSEAMKTVHAEINHVATQAPQTAGMGATLALAWFTPENLYIANAGDSRVYLSRGTELEQLSRDHTAAWGQWKRGEISEIQYRSHPRRSALYEVMGGGHLHLCPHLRACNYLPGDRLLICSDGLIDGLWERHIREALAQCTTTPAETADTLLKRAVDNSGADDASLIVISIE